MITKNTEILKEKDVQITEEINKMVDFADKKYLELQAFRIINAEHYELTGSWLKEIKTMSKALEDERMSQTRPIDEAKKRIIAFFNRPLENLKKCEDLLKSKLLDYQKEQKRIQEEQEAKLREQAKKDEEKLLKRADKAEENGHTEKADLLRQQAEQVGSTAPTVLMQKPKVDGIKTMKVWKARVDDIRKIPNDHIIAFLGDPKVKEKLDAYFSQIAKATKGSLKINGVTFFSEDVIASGRS